MVPGEIAGGLDAELSHRESKMLKIGIFKLAVAAVSGEIALISLGVTAATSAHSRYDRSSECGRSGTGYLWRHVRSREHTIGRVTRYTEWL